MFGLELVGSSRRLPIDVFERVTIDVIADGNQIIIMAVSRGTVLARMLVNLVGFGERGGTERLGKHQTLGCGGEVFVTDKEVEGEDGADK